MRRSLPVSRGLSAGGSLRPIEAQAPKGLPAVERFEIKLGLLLDHLPAEWKTDIRRRADEVARTAGAGLNLPTLAHLTARPANDDFVLAPREPRQVLSDLLVGVAAEPR